MQTGLWTPADGNEAIFIDQFPSLVSISFQISQFVIRSRISDNKVRSVSTFKVGSNIPIGEPQKMAHEFFPHVNHMQDQTRSSMLRSRHVLAQKTGWSDTAYSYYSVLHSLATCRTKNHQNMSKNLHWEVNPAYPSFVSSLLTQDHQELAMTFKTKINTSCINLYQPSVRTTTKIIWKSCASYNQQKLYVAR